MPKKKYLVTLSDEERNASGTTAAGRESRHPQSERAPASSSKPLTAGRIRESLKHSMLDARRSSARANASLRKTSRRLMSVRAPVTNRSWMRRLKRASSPKRAVPPPMVGNAGRFHCWLIVWCNSSWPTPIRMRLSAGCSKKQTQAVVERAMVHPGSLCGVCRGDGRRAGTLRRAI